MEVCPNCENQIEQDQLVCLVCRMILKDIRSYPNLVKPFSFICLAVFTIALLVNLIGHLLPYL